MFKLFRKNPRAKLQKAYEPKLEQAMHRQRIGDIRGYSALHEEADGILKQIEALAPHRQSGQEFGGRKR